MLAKHSCQHRVWLGLQQHHVSYDSFFLVAVTISGRNNQRDKRYTVAIIREFWCIMVGKAWCQDLSSCRTSMDRLAISQQTRSKTGPGLGKAKGLP